MTELERLRLAYAECSRQRNELLNKLKSHAQRKPLTDDPLQGAVDWLLEADGEYFCTATVQRTLRIGYNRAKRLCDTAKERSDQGIKGGT